VAVKQQYFNSAQLQIVNRTCERAVKLVSDHYRVAPREWLKMPYEVRTLRSLDSSEVTDKALAQTLCYAFTRHAGSIVVNEGDLFRICLQDHRILGTANDLKLELGSLLTYVLTHELIHVVRFGQHLEKVDLPQELRSREEQKVEKTTQTILAKTGACAWIASSLTPTE
jgi:hypothetical protein